MCRRAPSPPPRPHLSAPSFLFFFFLAFFFFFLALLAADLVFPSSSPSELPRPSYSARREDRVEEETRLRGSPFVSASPPSPTQSAAPPALAPITPEPETCDPLRKPPAPARISPMFEVLVRCEAAPVTALIAAIFLVRQAFLLPALARFGRRRERL